MEFIVWIKSESQSKVYFHYVQRTMNVEIFHFHWFIIFQTMNFNPFIGTVEIWLKWPWYKSNNFFSLERNAHRLKKKLFTILPKQNVEEKKPQKISTKLNDRRNEQHTHIQLARYSINNFFSLVQTYDFNRAINRTTTKTLFHYWPVTFFCLRSLRPDFFLHANWKTRVFFPYRFNVELKMATILSLACQLFLHNCLLHWPKIRISHTN